jgi:hypothetical protein
MHHKDAYAVQVNESRLYDFHFFDGDFALQAHHPTISLHF